MVSLFFSKITSHLFSLPHTCFSSSCFSSILQYIRKNIKSQNFVFLHCHLYNSKSCQLRSFIQLLKLKNNLKRPYSFLHGDYNFRESCIQQTTMKKVGLQLLNSLISSPHRITDGKYKINPNHETKSLLF